MGTSKESKGPSRKSRKNEKAEKAGVEGSSVAKQVWKTLPRSKDKVST